MPTIVELPDKTELEFPDGMDQMAMREEIAKAFPQFVTPTPSESPAIPAPGQTAASKEPIIPYAPGQVFPAREQQFAEGRAYDPSMSAEEAEALLMTPGIQIPNVVPKSWPITRGVFQTAKSIPEFVTAPGAPYLMAAQLIPGVRETVDALMGAGMVKSAAQLAGEASATGNREQMAEAVTSGLLGAGMVAGPHVSPILADEIAARRVGSPDVALADMAARQALSIRDLPLEIQQSLVAQAPATPPTGGLFNQRALENANVALASRPKGARPVIPETPPEPERGLTVIQEIRARGADTKEKIRALFPQLSRETAAKLRDQAFPREKIPDNLSQNDVDRLFLDRLNEESNREIEQAERIANASRQQEAATVYGNLRPPAVEGAREVPAQESGQGVQPQTTGGIPQKAKAEPAKEGVESPANVVRDLALKAQREAGWNPKWPFVPADLLNADFRDLIRNDPGLSTAEKDQIFTAGEKLGVVSKGEPRTAEPAAQPLTPSEQADVRAELAKETGEETPEPAAPPAKVEAESAEAPPKIVAVASRLGEQIETGRIHLEAEQKLRRKLGISTEDPRAEDIEHGFLDDKGNFLGREEAWEVARKANQLKTTKTEDPGFLGKEDLKKGAIEPTAEPARNWDAYYENLVDDLDSFSPARESGRRSYEMDDVAQRFVDFAKNDKSGKPLSELASDFAEQDEATASQVKKLRASVKNLEGQTPKPEGTAPKEPWQMTKAAFSKEPEPDYPATYRIELNAVANREKPAHYGFYPKEQAWAREVYNEAKRLGLFIKKGPRKNDYIITLDTEHGRARADTIFAHISSALRDPALEDDILWHDRFGKLLGYGPEFEGKIVAISGPKELENQRLHRYYVAKALREGKPVPAEVLDDYPDLKQPPAETPQPAEPAKGEGLFDVAKNWTKQQSDVLKGFLATRMDLYDRWKSARGAMKKTLKTQLDAADKELEQAKKVHHDAIEQAYNEGKPVPPDVLKDYPDLANLMPTKALRPTEQAAAKVEQEVQNVAKTKGQRPAKEVKSELVDRLERAIDVAPSENEVAAKSYTTADMKRHETPDRAEKATIDIPGDGVFTIRNTKEALTEILKRAKRISTTSGETKPIIPRGAVESSEKALGESAKAKEAELRQNIKVNQEDARGKLYDAINKSENEGIAGRSQPEEDPETYPEGTRWREWRIRKATPEERTEHWKGTKAEIRWVGERRVVKFSQEKGRTEGEWMFDDSGKTRADVVRGMEANMPKDAVIQDEGVKQWRNLERMEGGYAFLREGKTETSSPPISPGPGAAAAGEPGTYSAISQLSDKLKTTPAKTPGDGLRAREKMADAWAEGKGLMQRVFARLRTIPETLKAQYQHIRSLDDVTRRIAEFDAVVQQSVVRSKQAGKAFKAAIRNTDMRNGMAFIMEGATDAQIRTALDSLPEGTKPYVRRALESALKLPQDVRDHASNLRDFYEQRGHEAIDEGIMEKLLEDYYTHVWKDSRNMPSKLANALNRGRVNEYFQYAMRRRIPTLLEGIAEGKEPVLDPASVIPRYNYLLDRAIASRHLMKALEDVMIKEVDPATGETSERPLLAPTGTRTTIYDQNQVPQARLIKIHISGEKASDYRAIDHPSLRKWIWAATDEQGVPVFYEGDLRVHPDHYERLARMMDRSRLTAGPMQRKLLAVSTEVKGFKLGVASFFHPVQVGTHALFHLVSPLVKGEIDADSPMFRFAVEKGGVNLAPDQAAITNFAEGILTRGLVNKIPIIGPWSHALAEWTFGEYIPRLKLATFEAFYERNLKRYPELTDEQNAARAGDAVNNAYGELNHLWLGKEGRDPATQRLLRLGFLAPDFGEARLRFVSKAFTRYGGEERLGLIVAGTSLFLLSRALNIMTHGDPELADFKHMFDVKIGDRWIGLRSIVGDISHLLLKPRQFWEVRLNPLYSRSLLALLSGRDVAGHRLTPGTFAKDVAKQVVPIHLSGLTRDDRQVWESFLAAMGLQTWRAGATSEIHRLAQDWRDQRGIKDETEVLPAVDSPYRKARLALEFQDRVKFRQAITELYNERRKLGDPTPRQTIQRNFNRYYHQPFAGNQRLELLFKRSLTSQQQSVYRDAQGERNKLWRQFETWF